MSAHPSPRATRAIRAETAGSSGLALGPNPRGKAAGEVEASIPVMMATEDPSPNPIQVQRSLMASCHTVAGVASSGRRSLRNRESRCLRTGSDLHLRLGRGRDLNPRPRVMSLTAEALSHLHSSAV